MATKKALTAKDLRVMRANSTPGEADKTLFSKKYNRPRTSAAGMKGKKGSQSGKSAK